MLNGISFQRRPHAKPGERGRAEMWSDPGSSGDGVPHGPAPGDGPESPAAQESPQNHAATEYSDISEVSRTLS